MADDIPNRITVSFDQNRAVRDDGAELVAVKSQGKWDDCSHCAAFNPFWRNGCNISEADKFRFCDGDTRKDGRNVHWRLKND